MRKGSTVAAFVMALVALPAPGSAQRPRWLGGGGALEYQVLDKPGIPFRVEYPKREWQVVPGAGSVLVVFTQNKAEASAAVEQTTLQQALAPEEITQLFADLELDSVKARQPAAQAFRAALRTEADGRRTVVIDFSRAGLRGKEQVRQYSLPFGDSLFRLICSAPEASFAKYAAIFEHMADTFQLAAPAPTREGSEATGSDPLIEDARPVDAPPSASAITAPVLRRHVVPQYPPIAIDARMQGVVKVRATVGADGTAEDVAVVDCIRLLDGAAVAAVRQWEFTPLLVNGFSGTRGDHGQGQFHVAIGVARLRAR